MHSSIEALITPQLVNQYFDDGVVFLPEGMDPDHSAVMIEHGLQHGDRVSGPLYPLLWRRHQDDCKR